MITERIAKVRLNIKKACDLSGRSTDDVSLICVTKEANSAQILDALGLGISELGENRVKDALLKFKAIDDKALWHMIGHLQTNKVKDAVSMFSFIHSVDSLKLAQAINKCAEKINKKQDVLVEVNVSGEKTKFGVKQDSLAGLIDEMSNLNNIRLLGLMTVTPYTQNPDESRRYFSSLKKLADNFGLKELSMGMSQDYGQAIQEGATMVRVGHAIFGED